MAECVECGKKADWLDRNFAPAKPYCDEHVVQSAHVQLMNVYDWLIEAGHDVVLVAPLLAGISTYCCERCGGLIKIQDGEIVLFFTPEWAYATSSSCMGVRGLARTGPEGDMRARAGFATGEHRTLRAQMKKLFDSECERISAAAEE